MSTEFIIFDHEKECPIKSKIWESIQNYHSGSFTKIYARNCEIREVPAIESREFLTYNHLQGNYYASVNLGLYYNDELCALMTFSKPRYNKQYQWELIRYCNKIDHQILGGASKLFSHFIKTYKPKHIISYADKRHSQGNLYSILGFDKIGESSPNYWYKKDNIILSRISCQKHKLKNILGDLFNPNMTEKENMINAGFEFIRDLGNLVYVKTFNENLSYNQNYYIKNRDKIKNKSKNAYDIIKSDPSYKFKRKEKYQKYKADDKVIIDIKNIQNVKIINYTPYNKHCVYCITNTINDKKYIGITERDLLSRFHEHSTNNTPLGKAIRKYGEQNFTIDQLHINLEYEQARLMEMKEIENYNTLVSGYNQTYGGEGLAGIQMSDTVKKKLREENQFRKYTLENTESGEIIQINSLRQFCIERGYHLPNFSKIMKGIRKTAHGWKIHDISITNPDKTQMVNIHRKVTESTKNKIRQRQIKYIWRIQTPDGLELEVDSLELYSNQNNINSGNMRGVADGLYTNYKGYKVWRLDATTKQQIGVGPKVIQEIMKYEAHNIETGEKIKISSLRDFGIKNNLGYKYLHKFIQENNPRTQPYKGWIIHKLNF